MKGRRLIALAWLGLAAGACARTHGPMSIEIRDAQAAASGRAGHAATGDASAGKTIATGSAGNSGRQATRERGAAEPDAASVTPGADAAVGTPVVADAAAGDSTEVWIGQLWSVTPGLCDPNAPWPDTPVVVQPMGYVDRVVLILQPGGGSELRGRIQLGEGVLPTSPGDAPYIGPDSGSYWYWHCSIQLPTKGVEYPLLEPVLTSDRLMFEISASAVWDTFCASQSSPCPGAPPGWALCSPPGTAFGGTVCACENGSCKAAQGSLVAFDLAVTADTIEGEVSLSLGGGFGTPAELRLRRVQ